MYSTLGFLKSQRANLEIFRSTGTPALNTNLVYQAWHVPRQASFLYTIVLGAGGGGGGGSSAPTADLCPPGATVS